MAKLNLKIFLLLAMLALIVPAVHVEKSHLKRKLLTNIQDALDFNDAIDVQDYKIMPDGSFGKGLQAFVYNMWYAAITPVQLVNPLAYVATFYGFVMPVRFVDSYVAKNFEKIDRTLDCIIFVNCFNKKEEKEKKEKNKKKEEKEEKD